MESWLSSEAFWLVQSSLVEALTILKAPEVSASYAEHINLNQVGAQAMSFMQVTRTPRPHTQTLHPNAISPP
eukprot:5368920-Amphidinium_carterae.1